MTAAETPLMMACAGETLTGIVHRPSTTAPTTGLLILTGGPQYRVGAHRQYVHLARAVAQAGFPALRFDYRGMGDSSGPYPGLDRLGPDIAAAAAAFKAACPSLTRIVPWGLCEGASAILLHGTALPGFSGGILANPWLADDAAQARGMIRRHYGGRIMSGQFWRRMLTGKVPLGGALSGLWRTLRRARSHAPDHSLSARMAAGLAASSQPYLCLLSGSDDTAAAFQAALEQDPAWCMARGRARLDCAIIEHADHVFADPQWRNAAAQATIVFLRRLDGGAASTTLN